MLGLDAGGLRLPMVELTDDEASRVSAMLDRQGLAVAFRG